MIRLRGFLVAGTASTGLVPALLLPTLVLTLASGLVACGGSSDSEPPPVATEIDQPTTEPVEPPLPEPLIPPAETTPAVSPAPEPPADPTPTQADASVAAAADRSAPAEADASVPAVASPEIPAEADTPAPDETDAPPPIMPPTATATPTGPAVTVTGPLLVFSERVGVEEETDDREVEVRRILIYDLGLKRYWTAFDYRNVRIERYGALGVNLSAVQPAGTSLIVWSEGQIRRMSLNGETEAVLFKNKGVEEIQVSPDGTKVAVMVYDLTLLVLDTATGEELLVVDSSNPSLQALSGGRRDMVLGDWHADGNALSVTGSSSYPRPTAILGLDGDIRVLPEDLLVSPDLRYALRFGEVISEGNPGAGRPHLWESIDVVDVETDRVVWTISGHEGVGSGAYYSWWAGESKYVVFSVPSLGGDTRILDTATGEILSLPGNVRNFSKVVCAAAASSPATMASGHSSAMCGRTGMLSGKGRGAGRSTSD